jgi:hypothetical protein
MGVQLHFEIWFISRMIGVFVEVLETILNPPPAKVVTAGSGRIRSLALL